MKTIILLTRHGETEKSKSDVYYGRSASSLTMAGKTQQKLLLNRLKDFPVSGLYTSPSARCLEAARPIGAYFGITATKIEALNEIDHGKWEGLSRDQVAHRFSRSYPRWQRDPAANAPDGGESGYAVAARAVPAILEIVRKSDGQSVVVVGHNTVNRIILCHFLNLPLREYRNRIEQYPATLNCIVFAPDENPKVVTVNDFSHWHGQVVSGAVSRSLGTDSASGKSR